MQEPIESSSPTSEKIYVILGLLLLVAIGLRAPISTSLWLDETVTAWLIKSDFSHLWGSTIAYQGQSPLYYSILWVWSAVFGSDEWVFRVPSIIFSVLSLITLFKIGNHFLGRRAAAISVLILIGLDPFQRAAFSARPYAFTLLCCLSSFWFLRTWLLSGGLLRYLAWVVTSLGIFYGHYLFATFFLLQGVLFLTTPKELLQRRLMAFAVGSLVIGLACIPGYFQLASLNARKTELHFASLPGMLLLLNNMFPAYLLVYLGLGAIFTRIYYPLKRQEILKVDTFRGVLLFWYIFPPISLFVLSHLGSTSLFVDRYFLWYTPALAMLSGWVLASVENARARTLLLASVFGFMCFREVLRQWQIEDWREVGRIAGLEQTQETRPVLLYSGLIESAQISQLNNPASASYIAAPAEYYKFPKERLLIPPTFQNDSGAEYFSKNVIPFLGKAPRALLVALDSRLPGTGSDSPLVYEGLIAKLSELGFSATELGSTGQVRIFRLSRVLP